MVESIYQQLFGNYAEDFLQRCRGLRSISLYRLQLLYNLRDRPIFLPFASVNIAAR
jgi:hypothetical protein